MDGAHIVIVDDEPELRDTIREYLELHGFAVTEAESAEAMRRHVSEGLTFDLALIDITMPGEDGLSLARFLRDAVDTRIIMVTASGDVVDRVVGLEIGADDYLPKPVDLRELVARVRAVLRPGARGRSGQAHAGEAPGVRFGGFRLDTDARALYGADGAEIEMTPMEFDLLRAFVEHPNRVLSRDQLLELAHHRRWEPFDRSIDIRVARVRKKIEADPAKPALIKTVHGVGYVFSPPSDC